MTTSKLSRSLFALIVCALLAAGVAACGDDDEGEETTTSAQAIQENPDNNGVEVTVGSKNFTEEFVLGEIYAQALEAAGYDVKTDLNLGSEQIALKALQAGEISGYPEYTSTALTSFFDTEVQDVPNDPEEAADQAKTNLEQEGLTSFAPTPFEDSNAVGTLTTTADDLGLETISDLEGQSEDLTLYGSPECRQRPDCLVGLEDDYGLKFKKFTPVDIGLRYEVLDKGQADLSIIFTTDAQLSTRKDVVTLVDDKKVFPPGNVTFVARKATVDKAGSDMQETIELVQEGLTEQVMRELNARVDVDRETPKQAAREYLREAGYI